MTSREQFEAWWNGNNISITIEYDKVTAFEAWQARGEVDAKRIAELEAKLDKVKRVLFLGKAQAEANERYLDELASECSDPNL